VSGRITKLTAALTFAAALAVCQDTSTEPEMHLGRGYDALKQGRYDEAASEFQTALRLDPKLVMRARFPLAVALFELKQSAAARREFEAVRREAGDHPNVRITWGGWTYWIKTLKARFGISVRQRSSLLSRIRLTTWGLLTLSKVTRKPRRNG
jgi:Tfp pilus assembly protein PilF